MSILYIIAYILKVLFGSASGFGIVMNSSRRLAFLPLSSEALGAPGRQMRCLVSWVAVWPAFRLSSSPSSLRL